MFWWRRKQQEQDLARELRSHLELEAEEQQADGLLPEDARYAARRAFGNTTQVQEEVRTLWGGTLLEQAWQELRYAARTLRQSPGFTLGVVFTLALGIGANSAIFSVVNGVLLKPPSLADAGQLVNMYARDSQGQRQYVSPPDLDDWRVMTHSFSGLASWVGQSVNLTGGEQPERLLGLFVSSNFLPVLGVAPAIGRGFAPGDDRIGGERVAVVSNRLWHSHFAADPALVGKTAQFNGEPYTIIGILPSSFVFPLGETDVYLPASRYPNYSLRRGQSGCAVLGRLRAGVSLQAAQAEMDTIAARLATAYPTSNRGQGAIVVSFQDDLVARLKPSITALAGAVAFVLLIACANVAGLLIARRIARERERAVRVALGASRARLIAHVLTEAVLLAGTGGGLGLLLTLASMPVISSSISGFLPYGTAVEGDRTVVLFTAGVSLAAALLVAILPAWQSSHPVEFLRTGHSAGATAARNRARNILVSAEIALALVLLAGAGLMIKSFAELGRTDPGFDTHHLLMLAYRVPRSKYPSGAQQTQFHREVVARIKAVPGVIAATSVRAVPLGDNGSSAEFLLADRPEPPPAERPHALLNFVDPHFFSTLRIPVLAGRVFNEYDRPERSDVLLINRTLAHQYFSGRDPVGQLLRLPSLQKTGKIVGVVGDIKHYTLTDPPTPQIYGALAQNPFIFTSLAVRTAGDPLQMINPIRKAIWQVDRDQPVWSVHSFEEILSLQSRLRQLMTVLLGGYAGVAVLLSAIGIFGVISYSVSQRTAEIGVRLALGAQRRDVLRLILRQGLVLTALGIVSGISLALWLSRYLRSQLYAVSPLDPGVYAIVAVLLGTVALLACLVPARRAARVDPIVALRYE